MTRPTPTLVLTAAAFVCGLAAQASAADGVLVTQRMTMGTNAPTTSTFQIEKTRLRGEITDANGGKQLIIFDSAKQVLYLIDINRKTYTEMTRADVDQMGAQMQAMQAQMAAQMANLPPAQRAQVEAMMAGRGAAGMPGMAAAMAPATKPEYRRGGTNKVGRWSCNVHEGFENGQKTAEVCAVTAAALGFTSADFEVANQLSSFLMRMMPQAANQVAGFGTVATQGFDGFPVKSTTNIGGQQVTTEVTDISRQTFDDALFAVPPGLQKQDMMGGMGAMGRGRGRGQQ